MTYCCSIATVSVLHVQDDAYHVVVLNTVESVRVTLVTVLFLLVTFLMFACLDTVQVTDCVDACIVLHVMVVKTAVVAVVVVVAAVNNVLSHSLSLSLSLSFFLSLFVSFFLSFFLCY
jgi:hypothetical protein